jgi:hypothetical protein
VIAESVGRTKVSSRRRARRLLALVAAALVGVGGSGAGAETSAGAAVLGDYATPLVGAADANGVKHIDTTATVSKLSAAHINTYAYLIYDSPLYGTGTAAQTTQAQWNDLPGFASAAATAGIDVLVYLVPPTESTQAGYLPYGWNYKSWADAIASLAVTHPNIREIVMDDFAANTVEGGSTLGFAFTPAYVSQMMTSARATAPWLKFRVIMYYPSYVGTAAVMPAFRPVVDGVIFPYRATTPGGGFNTTDSSLATSQGKVVGAMIKCHGGNHCAQIEYPKNTPSTGGYLGSLSQTITVTAGATKTLTFWQDDDYNSTTSGFHYLQALIDGSVVWQSDVAASSDGLWHQQTVDVTSALAGRTSATLTLRVWDAHGVSNFHVTGWFDDVAGSGFTVSDGGFENASFAPWTASTNTPMFTVALVPTLDYDYMTYASKFSSESAPTGTTYVRSVLSQAIALIHAGVADGSIVYTLNLTGAADGRSDPADYGVVQSLYGAF